LTFQLAIFIPVFLWRHCEEPVGRRGNLVR
jgi:hypothetical protein